MRTIIAGSRHGVVLADIQAAVLRCGWMPTTVISGAAQGADHWGEVWSKWMGIPVERYPADWDRLGRSAGRIRNASMADTSQALIAIWDGRSPGTRHMIENALHKGLRVHVWKPASAR